MDKIVYGVPVPRGVRKDWDASSMERKGSGEMLRRYLVPDHWGDPTTCVAWFDRFGRLRACVGHYPNGRAALVRVNANGGWRTEFGRAPASVDNHPQGGDSTQIEAPAPLSGAVGEAETPKGPGQ